MSRTCCFALVALILTTSAAGQQKRVLDREARSRDRAIETVEDLQKHLREARHLLADVGNKRVREQLELLLSRAALKADDLHDELRDVLRRPSRPISDADFAKLLKELKDIAFDKEKVQFIETFVKGQPINCEQATQILKALSFEDGRVKAAIALYPSVVDTLNFYKVLKVFPFESNRKKVMDAVKQQKKSSVP